VIGKRGFLGGQVYTYDARKYLALSVPVPFECETARRPRRAHAGGVHPRRHGGAGRVAHENGWRACFARAGMRETFEQPHVGLGQFEIEPRRRAFWARRSFANLPNGSFAANRAAPYERRPHCTAGLAS